MPLPNAVNHQCITIILDGSVEAAIIFTFSEL